MGTEESTARGALTAWALEDAAVGVGSGEFAGAAAGLMTRTVDGLAAGGGGGAGAAAVTLAGLDRAAAGVVADDGLAGTTGDTAWAAGLDLGTLSDGEGSGLDNSHTLGNGGELNSLGVHRGNLLLGEGKSGGGKSEDGSDLHGVSSVRSTEAPGLGAGEPLYVTKPLSKGARSHD